MSSTAPKLASVTLPADLVVRLNAAAHAMGLDLPTYLVFLEQCRSGRLDRPAQDAARFMLQHHDASLRKLAQGPRPPSAGPAS